MTLFLHHHHHHQQHNHRKKKKKKPSVRCACFAGNNNYYFFPSTSSTIFYCFTVFLFLTLSNSSSQKKKKNSLFSFTVSHNLNSPLSLSKLVKPSFDSIKELSQSYAHQRRLPRYSNLHSLSLSLKKFKIFSVCLYCVYLSFRIFFFLS